MQMCSRSMKPIAIDRKSGDNTWELTLTGNGNYEFYSEHYSGQAHRHARVHRLR